MEPKALKHHLYIRRVWPTSALVQVFAAPQWHFIEKLCLNLSGVATILVVMVATTVATKHILPRLPLLLPPVSVTVLIDPGFGAVPGGHGQRFVHFAPVARWGFCSIVLFQVSKGKLGSESKVLCRGGDYGLGSGCYCCFWGRFGHWRQV